MLTGFVAKVNSPLAFGVWKSIRLQSENQFQQRALFRQHISGHLSVKSSKALVSKSDFELAKNKKGNQVSGITTSSSLSMFSSSQVLGYRRNSCLITTMAASGAIAASGDIIVDNHIPSCGSISNFTKPTGVYFLDANRRGSHVRMRSRVPSKNNVIQGYYIFDITHRASNINPFAGQSRKKFTSSSTCYSDGPVPDGTLKEAPHDEPVPSLAIGTDDKKLHSKTLKLVSGSSYLPHPDKESTGGEDAHFICEDEQVIGVADGVGGWADVGVNAGEYSRALMSNSVRAIQDEPKDAIDPARVLVKAHSATKDQGSSTACIIALKDQGLHAINLGDSGFLVIRDGCTVFQSPVQQHDFNFTYQLATGNEGDLPSSGQVFNIPVLPGDVIVAGTDGLFDNLYNKEVTALVVQGVRSKLGPEAMARNIAALARQKALDTKRLSPFSAAAQQAGFLYFGGKLDDITVVVSFVTNAK